ncbi:MAG: sulfatase-like hydrolase/transferase [bacterium]|nr:sulfatase-like hydrolase/transferase [bacterium]
MRILYLDLDTLRPDHLGCYGYHRNTSPNIDRIAAEGVRFTNYYCSDAPCLPSRAALMMGRFGIHTGVVGHGGTAADVRLEGASRGFRDRLASGEAQSLPMMLRNAGLFTVSISPFAERHSAWWFYAGFREMHNTGRGGSESAEEVTPVALDWIQRNAKQDDWFLHINYWDPHSIYRAPEDFGNPFENEPISEWLTEDVLEQHRRKIGPNSASELNMWTDRPEPDFPRHVDAMRTMDDLRRHMDGYDCGIAYMDSHIGRLFEALEAEGVMDDLVVIVSADHGENQGELGIYKEHGTADQITCRIPMIVRWPGAPAGHVDTGLHYNLDLAPTLAELLGQGKHPLWDGESYAAALTDGADAGRESLVLSQCAHVCQRSARFGPWLYMRTYHDGYHLFPGEMLYNVEEDPHEQRDLAADRPDVCSQGARILGDWHEGMMTSMPDAVDPLWTVMREGGPFHCRGQLSAYCERLEATGRGEAVPELKRRHPDELG